ncbi:protein ELYS isoform X2 [Mixophyes fleayi]|uniref:protein ELYS isoform X2 n=1 Tax=Mixophyes fleayi TaxID=3061075 RepID=UPI003F4DF829
MARRPVHSGRNMQNLDAKVTSTLLQFPQATVKALHEDEINLDSVLCAKFASGKSGLAWLACGPQLEVTNSKTGQRLSAYRFSGITERSPSVVAVKEFSWQRKIGLLVGLVEAEGSVLCLYDVGISRVVKSVVVPGSVTAVEPIVNHGGASAHTQHLHQSLRWFFGVAAVVTDVGHVLLIDLCLDDVSSNQDELDASDLEVISGIPAEIPKLREVANREGRHLCLQLLAPSGTTVSALCYISRTNQLAVGFGDGYLSLWNMKTLRREYHVQVEGGRVPVFAVTFQEPENDPRNCCYLWAVQTSESGQDVSLHMLQLAFGDKKCLPSGQTIYENLEYCEERYSLDLSANVMCLRGQTYSTKLLAWQTIEKFRAHSERDDGLHEVTSPDTSVSIFTWQVNTYGQAKPSIYMGVFDINRWYQAQMPDSLRPGQFLGNCSYFGFWTLEALVNMAEDSIFDILVRERSLSRRVLPSYPPPEQFYDPSTYSFDAVCLLGSGIIHITCTGFQKETVNFLKNSGSSLNETIHDGYNRCLVAGLLSPRLSDIQPSSLSQEEQLHAVLSTAVETSSISLLTSCIKEWTTGELPRSADSLRFVLEWTWNKVVHTKQDFDNLCIPLFDGSCNFIDPQTLQSLQHCQLRLSNLNAVLNCFLTEAQELTERGLTDLTNKQTVTSLLNLYASVVLWFCRCGLLPDNSDEALQLTGLYYNHELLQRYYTERRKKLEHLSGGKWHSSLMIDSMICQFGAKIENLWRRDEGGTGKYPPANLHGLLDLYLLENADEMSKHAITIYFLLDIMYSFPDKPESSIESFPSAFSVPCALVKLIQGFWLLDHNDYKNSVDLILHPSACKTSWQHTHIIEMLLCQGDHRLALRYIQVLKPPVATSTEVKLHMSVLLANKYIIEAWNLQRSHCSRLNVEELLKHMYETCQEMGIMEDLLKLNFTDSEQDYLHKFLHESEGVHNQELLLVHHLQRANYVPALQLNQSLKRWNLNDCDRRLQERAVTRNAILDQYGKMLPSMQRTLANEKVKPYSSSSITWKEVTKPKPLSTFAKLAPPGTVITKAKFISNVLLKIKEVSVANVKTEFSPYKSLTNGDQHTISPLPHSGVSDAFFGIPVSTSKRLSRFLDSVVHPVLAESSPLATDFESFNQRTPSNFSMLTSSPVQSSLPKIAQLKNIARASEFNLLETPPVVRKAKALAASTASSFTAHTSQSILRSSAHTTPLVSPSISPGRSVTPPLRSKDPKISFMEQINCKYTKGILTPNQDLPMASPILKSYQNTTWAERVAILTHNTSTKDNEELDESSSVVQDESPHKIEVCKDASDVSLRSEYYDASTHEDLENDVVAVTTEIHALVNQEPAHSEITVLISDDVLPVKEDLKPQERDIEEANIECLSLPENRPEVLHQLTPVQDIDLPFESVIEAVEGNTKSVEIEPDSSTKDSAFISIHDSEEIESAVSEHFDEEMEVNGAVELQFVEENVLLVEDFPTVTSPLPHCVEVQIVKETEVNIQMPEPEPIMAHQLVYPVTEIQLNCSVENIEHRYKCELGDGRESVESETDVEEEHFVAHNNFSLILEGDAGQDEEDVDIESLKQDHTGDEALKELTKVSCTVADKDVALENPINDVFPANTFSFVASEQETTIMETLPYVPEPIKVAISENLLDVFKDTRSKDFTTEVNRDSVHEKESVKKLRNSQTSSGSPVNGVKQTNAEDLFINKVIQPATPPEKENEQRVGEIIKLQASPSEGKSALINPPTPRRSIRRTTKVFESTNDNSEVQLPTTPSRGGRKAKGNIQNLATNISTIQEEQITISTTRISRRTKSSLSEKPQSIEVEIPLVEEMATKLPSSPARIRRGKAFVLDQINDEDLVDIKVAIPLTPTRITRSSKIINQSEKETFVKNVEVEQQIATPIRGRRGKHPVNELVKHFELNATQASDKHDSSPPASPKRVSLRWSRIKSENQIDLKSAETMENVKAQEQMIDTPRKRAKRSTIGKLDVGQATDVSEKHFSIDQAVETNATRSLTNKPNTMVRVSRKSALPSLSENIVEERLQLPETQGIVHNVAGEEQKRSTRFTRTRSSSTSLFLDTPAVPFEFSTPTPKRRKNAKAEQTAPPISPVELQPLVSQYVFSPPSLRKRTTRTTTNVTLTEKDAKVQKSHEGGGTEEPVVKPQRGRPPKHKANKQDKETDKVEWSPPPVKIQLLSPPESPTVNSESVKPSPTASKDAQINPLRKTRRRIVTSKPVTRRKIR